MNTDRRPDETPQQWRRRMLDHDPDYFTEPDGHDPFLADIEPTWGG